MLEFLRKRILRKNKNNKGNSAITSTITYLMFVFLLAFSLDLIVLVMNLAVVGYETVYISHKLSAQGGFIGDNGSFNSAGQQVYKNSPSWLANREIVGGLNSVFNMVGMDPEDWELIVYDKANPAPTGVKIYSKGIVGSGYSYVSTFHTLNNTTDDLRFSPGYGSVAGIKINFTYKWRFAGRMLAGEYAPTLSMSADYRSDYLR